MLIYDGSRYRPIVDIQAAIAAGLGAVLYKATQGTSYVDPTYAAAKKLCLDNGILFGAYHFIESGNIKAQAAHFVSVVQPADNMAIALDWEEYANGTEAAEWVQHIHDLLGVYPIVYT